MRPSFTTLACAVAGATLSGLTALSVGAASAATDGVPVPLTQLGTGFHQIVTDPAAGFLFFSSGQDSATLATAGPGATGIVVTDLSGGYVTTIEDGTGVDGLALSTDGSTLYAALSANSSVAAVSVSSITSGTPAVTSYSLPSGYEPYALAVQRGKLWVSYNIVQSGPAANAGQSGIGYFVLPTTANPATPAFESQASMGTWSIAPELSGSPTGSGTLAAMTAGTGSVAFAAYDVSVDPPTVTVSTNWSDNTTHCVYGTGVPMTYAAAGLQVLAGGGEVELSCGREFMIGSAMNPAATFGGYGPAAPIAGGGLAVGVIPLSGGTGGQQSTLRVYAPSTYLAHTFTFASGLTLAPGGLATGPGDYDVYAVLRSAASGGYELQVLPGQADTQSAITIDANKVTTIAGQGVTVFGTLTLRPGLSLAAGTTVDIKRTDPKGATVTTPVTVASNGTFSLTDDPLVAGTNTYTASYAGSAAASIPAISAVTTVQVQANQSTLKLHGSTPVTWGNPVTVTGTLSLTR